MIHNFNKTPISIGSSKDLVKGQSLAAIGHSSGSPVPLTTGGYVVSTYKYNKGKIILSSAKFRLGASGSGLFDMKGNLVKEGYYKEGLLSGNWSRLFQETPSNYGKKIWFKSS